MITIFRYNGKIYKPENLERKLKKLKITINDIEILNNQKQKDSTPDIDENIILYKWINKINNNIHISINNTLDDMKSVSGFVIDDWERIN